MKRPGHDGARDDVFAAADLIAELAAAGLPVLAWSIHPFDGHASLHGQVCPLSDVGDQAVIDVPAVVAQFAGRFGVRPAERGGAKFRTLHAETRIDGVTVDVWGVLQSAGSVR